MNVFQKTQAILRGKSGKKLLLLSVITFLLITVLVFLTVFRFFGTILLKQMEEYLDEIPDIIESRRNELSMRSRVYEEDILARAELGLLLGSEENADYTDPAMLERVRSAVSADSVSLLDGQGELLSTTGYVSPDEHFRACIQTLEVREPYLELYDALSADGKATGKKDGRGFVRLPVDGSADRSLVFEFSCDMMLALYNSADDWNDVFERMLSGRDGAAFVRTGGMLSGYPLDGFTDEQTAQLHEELIGIFQSNDSLWKTADGKPVRFVQLLGKRYLAMMMRFSEQDTDILTAFPLQQMIGNGIYIALAISVIVGFGIVLLQIYIFRRLLRKRNGEPPAARSRGWMWRTTWPGLVTMLVVTLLFSGMLLDLENRTDATFTATSKRISLQNEIELRESGESAIRSTFEDCYRTRAQVLASFLAEHQDYQTRTGLAKLSGIAGTDYLMRFDSAGKEIVSSNSYTGFSVGTNLGNDYKAVLLGYPSAVVGPAEDAYTGQMQLSTAVLMTDGEGKPDGFLLAVYSAGELNTELKRMSFENAVNSFTVQKGHIAAAVNDENGRFIAHTDPDMIGQKADDYLKDFQAGDSFEGSAEYDGKNVCVSAVSKDGKTLLFIVPERTSIYMDWIMILLIVTVLLILALLYYPNACQLIAGAMAEMKETFPVHARTAKPMAIFYDGYASFLTLFAFFALIASASGWWTSFDYVFSGQWSRGIHLFSVWFALFILAVTVFCVYLIRSVLRHLDNRLNSQARTVVRLLNSVVTYAATTFLLFSILSRFGVNTTALLASAGVVSIAIGMGAQSMASDLLAGFFMMLEGTVHVGDYVSVQNIKGQVVDMGIRTMTIVNETGNTITLNNSKASPLCNMGRNLPQPDAKSDKKPDKKPADGD